MASATLVEVQRQGHQLDKTEHGIDTVLFCCDCFDPHAAEDRTRHRRVQQRKQDTAALNEMQPATYSAQQMSAQRLALKGDPAYGANDAAARSELFAANIRRKTSSRRNEEVVGLGYGLPEADRAELEQEMRSQERNLDRIGTTVDSLRIVSLELQGELEAQAPQIEGLGERVHVAHDKLNILAKEARRV